MTLDIKDKIIIALFTVVVISVIASVIYIKVSQDNFNSKLQEQNNAIAKLSPTVKMDDTTYRKLIQEQNDILDTYLKTKDKALYDKIDKMGSQIIGITDTQIKIKDEIVTLKGKKDGITSATILTPDGTKREVVEFNRNLWKDFLNISGSTISATPKLEAETTLTLKQLKPFNIKVAILKDKEGKWDTIVSLPDFPDNDVVVGGRIDLNPIISDYESHWYNNFFVGASFYVSKRGIVTGPFVGFRLLNKLLVGPSLMIDSNTEFYYGLNVFYNIAGK